MKNISLIIILLLCPICLLAQTRTIKGVITSGDNKEPLPGVTVLNKSNSTGVASDIDGKYSLKVKSGDILVFSFVGYKSHQVKISDQKTLNVVLDSESEKLDDVVVIAYGGARKKGTVTGSVASVKGDVLESKPVASFDQALQGQIAGVQITTSSGEPTATSSVKIRGVSSMAASTAPLYIMDGVAISEGDFSSINTNDIASISVLKDASSTSIYGSRAANGVIVIATKKGRYGQDSRINFRSQYGVSNLMKGSYEMMNTKEILELEQELGIRYAGSAETQELATINTNWEDELYRQGQTRNYELSVVGGSERLSYYISGAYFEQEGIAPHSGLERITFRSNLEGRMKEWLKVSSNISLGYSNYQQTENSRTMFNPAVAALVAKPYLKVRNEDGSLIQSWDNTENLLYYMDKFPSDNEDIKMVGSLSMELNPIKGLYIKTLGGIDGLIMRGSSKSLPSYIYNQESGGSAAESYGRTFRVTLTNTLNYSFNINSRHSFILLLGQEALQMRSNAFAAQNLGIQDDRLPSLSAGTQPTLATGGTTSGYSYLSFFGRVEYNLDQKYFFDFSMRSDGSSRFAKDNRWGNFWSLGFMWNMKKSDFLCDNNIINDASLNLSVGTTGNSEIGYYDYMSWVTNGAVYNNIDGMRPTSSVGNKDITWENIFSTNLGVQLSLVNRIDLKAEVYRRYTTDMLMDVPLSTVTGYSVQTQNVGEMSNHGVEVELGLSLLSNPSGFNWDISTNFAYNQNKIEKLYDGADQFLSSLTASMVKEGEPLGSFFMPRYAGVNPANGEALWYDKEGNVVNEYSEDNSVLLGKTYYAPLNGGFTTNFSYKGITLSAFFNWVANRYVMNNMRFFTENPNISYVATWNQSKKVHNRWREPGDVTDIARADIPVQVNSDQWIDDASFVRLKNVTISYAVPSSILKRTNVIKSARIYVQGQNLLTWTKFEGYDPEDDTNVTFGRYPTARQFTFGLDFSF